MNLNNPTACCTTDSSELHHDDIEPYVPSSPDKATTPPPQGDRFVETFFADGSLGVTLRRRPEDGIVFIFEIVPNSQAVNLDVAPNDELWAVADSEIGETPLDKEAWNGLITFIKQSTRPLRLVWRRKAAPFQSHQQILPPPAPAPAPGGATSTANDVPVPVPINSNKINNASPQPPQRSSDFLELQKNVVRFLPRDKDPPKKLFMVDPAQVLKDGRRVLKSGELDMEAKGPMSNTPGIANIPNIFMKANNKRRVILCNDLLIVCIPQSGNMLQLEYILDLSTCKLRSLGHVFGIHGSATAEPTASSSSNNGNPQLLSFDIISPAGELQFFCDNTSAKEVWVLNLYVAICDCVQEEARALGWRHQCMLGTMHSAVIRRDEERIRELLALCESGRIDFLSIEAPDEDGYTPLHYACMLRLHNIVKILHEGTADVTATDQLGLTPLHWAAMQLDDFSLSLLVTHVFDLDMLDAKNRSPLVIACLEGRDISGKTDCVLLKKCIQAMLPHKPTLSYADSKGQSLLHYLAASWQYEAMDLLLDAGCPDINSFDNRYYMSPLHYAANATSVKFAEGDGMRIMAHTGSSSITKALFRSDDEEAVLEELNHPYAADTMRTLLKHGAKPNSKDVQGRTAIMIVLEPANESKWDKEELESAISVLLSHGARVDEVTNGGITGPNSVLNLLRTKVPDLNIAAFLEKWNLLPVLDCGKLDIKLNHFEPLLDVAEPGSGRDNKAVSPNTSASMCSLCNFSFTLFRRQHHCRLCSISVCDDCSKKRVIIDNVQIRACDCCYNRVLTVQKKVNQQEILNNIKPLSAANSYKVTAATTSSTVNTVEGKDKLQREQLFGGSTSPDERNKRVVSTSTSKGLAGTMGVMNETHEKLLERGEKLSQLSDRTSDMANQANEFARMAKQLNEQQKSRWF